MHVREGPAITGAPIVDALHGSSLPDPITAASQVMNVHVVSDGSVQGSGFTATFSCAPPAEEPEAPTEPENTDNTDPCMEPYVSLMDSGILDGAHGGDADCRWVLSCSAAADVPTLTFESFDTEADYDYVLLLLLFLFLLLLLHFLLSSSSSSSS